MTIPNVMTIHNIMVRKTIRCLLVSGAAVVLSFDLVKDGVGPYRDFTCPNSGDTCRSKDYSGETPDPRPIIAGHGVVLGHEPVLWLGVRAGKWRELAHPDFCIRALMSNFPAALGQV